MTALAGSGIAPQPFAFLGFLPRSRSDQEKTLAPFANLALTLISVSYTHLEFNRDGFPIVDHHTYVFLGDGCLMEGLSQEACSLAGTLGLGKLIVMYDDNGISIDGDVHQWFGDDTPARFEACGWHVISGVDGHDAAMLDAALVLARDVYKRQMQDTLYVSDGIVLRTHTSPLRCV